MARRRKASIPHTEPHLPSAQIDPPAPEARAVEHHSTAAPAGRRPWDEPTDQQPADPVVGQLIRFIEETTTQPQKVDAVRNCVTVEQVMRTLSDRGWLTTRAQCHHWLSKQR